MLVEQGRLAFVNGGWTMSDEANVNYEDFINNMKAGHDFLKETFDFKPTIGWHVDPFGHQSSTAALFAEMGFDAWFFARGDYQDKEIRMEDKSLEFLWRPFYENLGNRTEIFTHWMFDMYFSPANFTFEELWGNSPIVDDPNLRTYNLDERLEEFELLMRDRASHYKTDHILAVFGQDFAYLNAQKSFKNIDKLIYHFNKKYSHMKLVYSTPYDYVKAVHESKVKLPVQYDDMLPYASSPHDYWTGYYTSRANFKSLVKYYSEKFNSYSTLFAEDSLIDHSEEEEIQLMDTYTEFYHKMGLVQHHDAVAGTAKKRVMDDYSDQLYYSVKGATGQIFKTFGNLHDLDPRDFSM